jgi:hypothetical protein
MPVTYHRAVSFQELADFRRFGRLRAVPWSCEGKHMAHSADDARQWGTILHGAGRFAVLKVTVSDVVAKSLVHWDRLDGIGPACFATIEQLEGAEIVEVTE